MALATRPKPKAHHRKRQAQHHKQSKVYLRPYWPYLPMFAIVGLGILINNRWQPDLTNFTYGITGSELQVTKAETMIGSQNSFAVAIIVIMSAIAASIFLFQNWFRVQRVLNQGERFVVKHPWIDISLVVICTAGVLLTRHII